MTIDNLIAHICFIDYKRDAPQEILCLWLHFDPCSDFVWGSCDLFKYSQIHHRTKYPFVIFNMDNGSLSSRGGQPQNTFPFVNLSSPELYMCDPFKQLSWKCDTIQGDSVVKLQLHPATPPPPKKNKRQMNISPFEISINASFRDRNKGHTMYVTGENKKISTTIRLLGPQWDPNHLSSSKFNLYPSSTNSNPVRRSIL